MNNDAQEEQFVTDTEITLPGCLPYGFRDPTAVRIIEKDRNEARIDLLVAARDQAIVELRREKLQK
jgi:hypothetical protein